MRITHKMKDIEQFATVKTVFLTLLICLQCCKVFMCVTLIKIKNMITFNFRNKDIDISNDLMVRKFPLRNFEAFNIHFQGQL